MAILKHHSSSQSNVPFWEEHLAYNAWDAQRQATMRLLCYSINEIELRRFGVRNTRWYSDPQKILSILSDEDGVFDLKLLEEATKLPNLTQREIKSIFDLFLASGHYVHGRLGQANEVMWRLKQSC